MWRGHTGTGERGRSIGPFHAATTTTTQRCALLLRSAALHIDDDVHMRLATAQPTKGWKRAFVRQGIYETGSTVHVP